MQPTAPRCDRIWIPCQNWLVKGCKYSTDVPTIDLFPDPSYHGKWQASKRMKLSLWGALTHRGWAGVGREIERGMQRGKGRRHCERHTCWREGYYTRTAWESEEEGGSLWSDEEIQTQTWVEPVISGGMDLTQRWQPSFTGPSDASAGGWGLSIFNLTFRKNATGNCT